MELGTLAATSACAGQIVYLVLDERRPDAARRERLQYYYVVSRTPLSYTAAFYFVCRSLCDAHKERHLRRWHTLHTRAFVTLPYDAFVARVRAAPRWDRVTGRLLRHNDDNNNDVHDNSTKGNDNDDTDAWCHRGCYDGLMALCQDETSARAALTSTLHEQREHEEQQRHCTVSARTVTARTASSVASRAATRDAGNTTTTTMIVTAAHTARPQSSSTPELARTDDTAGAAATAAVPPPQRLRHAATTSAAQASSPSRKATAAAAYEHIGRHAYTPQARPHGGDGVDKATAASEAWMQLATTTAALAAAARAATAAPTTTTTHVDSHGNAATAAAALTPTLLLSTLSAAAASNRNGSTTTLPDAYMTVLQQLLLSSSSCALGAHTCSNSSSKHPDNKSDKVAIDTTTTMTVARMAELQRELTSLRDEVHALRARHADNATTAATTAARPRHLDRGGGECDDVASLAAELAQARAQQCSERDAWQRERAQLQSEVQTLQGCIAQLRRTHAEQLQRVVQDHHDTVATVEQQLRGKEAELRRVYDVALQRRDVRLAQLSETLLHMHDSSNHDVDCCRCCTSALAHVEAAQEAARAAEQRAATLHAQLQRTSAVVATLQAGLLAVKARLPSLHNF